MPLNPSQFRQISPSNPLSVDEARAILRHVNMTSGMDFQGDRVVMPSGLHLPAMYPNVTVEDFGTHGSRVSANASIPIENGNLGILSHDNRLSAKSGRPLSVNLAIQTPATDRRADETVVASTSDKGVDLDEHRERWPGVRRSRSRFVSPDHFGEAATDMFRNSEPASNTEREFNSRWIRDIGVPLLPRITFTDQTMQHEQHFNPHTGELGPVVDNWEDADG